MPSQDKITILMGVYNGADHLPAQLQSIAAQTHPNWHLHCSDDGSTDATAAVLDRFAKDHPGKVTVVRGPQDGFAANFMSLIRNLPDRPGHVSFADQDDIWEPEKLSRALKMLHGRDDPTLYAARYTVWFPGRDAHQPSPRLSRPASFRNALVENIATGNTIVLNPAAAALAHQAAQQKGAVYAQDWWLYLLITGAGGRVVFDDGPPVLLYRQHDRNVIGGGLAPHQKLRRKLRALDGAYGARLHSNLDAMTRIRAHLTPENAALVDQFAEARTASLPRRLHLLRSIAPYRQSTLGNLAFWGAASLGRI